MEGESGKRTLSDTSDTSPITSVNKKHVNMASNETDTDANDSSFELQNEKGSSQTSNRRGKKKIYLTDVVEMISNLTGEITKLTGEISSLKSTTESLTQEIVEIKKTNIETCTRISMLDSDLTELRLENAKLKSINEDLESRLTTLEYHQRRNSLLFEGLQEEYGENDVHCYNKVCDSIRNIPGIEVNNIKIARCHRVGHYKNGVTRPIIANFLWYGDITNILHNRSKLPRGVYVNEDLPRIWVDRRRFLRPILRTASRMEKYRGKCKLHQDKLSLDGKQIGLDT